MRILNQKFYPTFAKTANHISEVSLIVIDIELYQSSLVEKDILLPVTEILMKELSKSKFKCQK